MLLGMWMAIFGTSDQSEGIVSLRAFVGIGGMMVIGVAVCIGVLREPVSPVLEGSRAGGEVSLLHSRNYEPLTAILPGDYSRRVGLRNSLETDVETLEAFLKAESAEELLPFVAHQLSIESKVRAYYAENPLPVSVTETRFESMGLIPETALQASIFSVTIGDRSIPVSILETEAGFKIDWVAFIQFKDATLEKFLSDPESEGGQFLVQLRRSHYFGSDVGGIDRLNVVRIQSPVEPGPSGYAFAGKETATGKLILEKYPWGKGFRPVVDLEWVEPEGGGSRRIEIVNVVRDTWRR